MGGTAVREPVAITQRLERMRRPSTSASSGDRKRAIPCTTSTPRPRKRSGESCGSMAAMTRRTRAITAAKSASASPARIPYSDARRMVASTAAERRIALEGTHPVHRHSPPSRCRSTSAVRAPIPAETAAVTSPAVPPPITARSNRSTPPSSSGTPPPWEQGSEPFSPEAFTRPP
jgi:hypothetical protein